MQAIYMHAHGEDTPGLVELMKKKMMRKSRMIIVFYSLHLQSFLADFHQSILLNFLQREAIIKVNK